MASKDGVFKKKQNPSYSITPMNHHVNTFLLFPPPFSPRLLSLLSLGLFLSGPWSKYMQYRSSPCVHPPIHANRVGGGLYKLYPRSGVGVAVWDVVPVHLRQRISNYNRSTHSQEYSLYIVPDCRWWPHWRSSKNFQDLLLVAVLDFNGGAVLLQSSRAVRFKINLPSTQLHTEDS